MGITSHHFHEWRHKTAWNRQQWWLLHRYGWVMQKHRTSAHSRMLMGGFSSAYIWFNRTSKPSLSLPPLRHSPCSAKHVFLSFPDIACDSPPTSLPFTSNGTVANTESGLFLRGSTVTYNCIDHYALSGHESSTSFTSACELVSANEIVWHPPFADVRCEGKRIAFCWRLIENGTTQEVVRACL